MTACIVSNTSVAFGPRYLMLNVLTANVALHETLSTTVENLYTIIVSIETVFSYRVSP